LRRRGRSTRSPPRCPTPGIAAGPSGDRRGPAVRRGFPPATAASGASTASAGRRWYRRRLARPSRQRVLPLVSRRQVVDRGGQRARRAAGILPPELPVQGPPPELARPAWPGGPL